LKRRLGRDHVTVPQLPMMIEDAHICPLPQAVLDKRVKKKKKKTFDSLGLSPMEVTWEDQDSVKKKVSKLFPLRTREIFRKLCFDALD